jgi:hypothetical protein
MYASNYWQAEAAMIRGHSTWNAGNTAKFGRLARIGSARIGSARIGSARIGLVELSELVEYPTEYGEHG